MTRYTSVIGAALLALAIAAGLRAAQPQVTAIRGGRVVPVNGPAIENGTVIIADGKITAVGAKAAVPKGASVIDAKGGWVLPGLVDAHTSIGLAGERRDGPPDELSDANTPQLLVLDGFNPYDRGVRRLVMAGITTALVTPGRANVIAGQPAVVRLAPGSPDGVALLSPAGLKFSLGEGPKKAFGEKSRLPGTRMGAAFVVRKALLDAAEYSRKWKEHEAGGAKAPAPARDLALEPLARLLDGRLTAFIETYRADDIITALRLVDEFKLKAVLMGCTEGSRVAGEIARRKIPVIVGPMGVGPKRVETEEVGLENAARLAQAGVVVAIDSEDEMGIGAPEELPLAAALAVKGGLAPDVALRGITLTAAQLIGVGDRVGSLEPGKDADLTIFTGDPLYYRSRVRTVIAAGRVVYGS
ncbi:MAG TPA: amidohydrolase family protein [Vicinamibacterales bacterium]|nr:amidohydrolase family protein [Vicinamibacterales bacterium]